MQSGAIKVLRTTQRRSQHKISHKIRTNQFFFLISFLISGPYKLLPITFQSRSKPPSHALRHLPR
jgi:hypothetical protein